MATASSSKAMGFVAFVLLVAGPTVASFDYEASSSTRRGSTVESLWFGLQAILGIESAENAAPIWIGRLLMLAGIAILVLWIRKKNSTSTHSAQ